MSVISEINSGARTPSRFFIPLTVHTSTTTNPHFGPFKPGGLFPWTDFTYKTSNHFKQVCEASCDEISWWIFSIRLVESTTQVPNSKYTPSSPSCSPPFVLRILVVGTFIYLIILLPLLPLPLLKTLPSPVITF